MSLAPDGRARHWILDAVLGGAVALGAITMAHAALPDRFKLAQPEPAAQRVALAPRPVARPQPVLIAFDDPVPGREVVSRFGLRQLPWEEGGRLHAGVDIAADPGTPVLAAADGVVVDAGASSTYGRFVAVRHAEGLTSFYAHMGGVDPRIVPGLSLKAGEVVGRVGSSGTSTGPHLHFELRDRRDRPLNPTHFLGKAFAEADDLPLRAARRFSRRVHVAYVSMIPASKRDEMAAKAQKLEAEKALKEAETALKLAARKAPPAAAPDAASAAQPAAAVEGIEGLKGLGAGEDGRPRAKLTL